MSRRVRSRRGSSKIGHFAQARRRRATIKLEALEARTLLSFGPLVSVSASQVSRNLTDSTLAALGIPSFPEGSQNVPPGLPADLAQSLQDARTIATVTTTSSDSSNFHIYTGKPQSFMGPIPDSASPGTSQPPAPPWQHQPGQASGGTPAVSGKLTTANPQYLILPTNADGRLGFSAQAGTGPGGGYSPKQLAGAYGLSAIEFGAIKGDGTGQTIAVIEVGDNPAFVNTSDPNFSSSALAVFDQTFGLPDPPSLQKYDENGNPISSGPNFGQGLEIALDIEWAHAMAPGANIDVVEANGNGTTVYLHDLMQAAQTAASPLGASVVSISYGANLEMMGAGSYEQFLDATYLAPALAANPGVTFLAATGDGGSASGLIYPAASPLVASVGGTTLNITGTTWTSETGWFASGGGPSTEYPAPAYQQNVTGYSQRTNPDVSADADPNTGVSVYDPFDFGGWVVAGGTSVASPVWGGLVAIADQGRVINGGSPLNGPGQTLPALYSNIDYANNFHDITSGNNGYPAGPGYDLVTGIGTPQAHNLVSTLSVYQIPHVVSSNPAAGQVVTPTPPTTFSLTFDEPIDPASITASNFTVDGTPADSASLSADGLTITYTFNTSPATQQGPHTMSLPADSVRGAANEIGNIAFSAGFYYVQLQLQVTATSPAVGSVLYGPDIDLVVQFNKAFDPYSFTTSSFQLSQGTVVKAVPLTPQAIDLTLAGVTQDGTLTLTIPTGGVLDPYQVPNLAFSGTYIVQINSQAYPTPLQGVGPAGSLIYDPMVTGAINFQGDTDTYTLPLAANQTVTLILSVDPTLIGTLTVLDPGGNVIGTATGSAAGQTVVLQTAPVSSAGTYSLVVGGSGGTLGNYTMQALLNAVYKQSTDSINTIGTAYDLSSAFAPLGTTPAADRAGVLGTFGAGSIASTAIADFPMNEPNWIGPPPQVVDWTGNGHDGTAVGGANTVPDPTFGQVGSFNGNGQYVSVGGSYNVQGARTIVAWVDPQANSLSLGLPIITGGSVGQGDFFGIAGTGGENGTVPQYSLYVDHWGTPAYASTALVTPGVWNFVAMTYDGASTVSFYINGAFAGSVTSNGLYNYNINTYDIAGSTIDGTTTEGSYEGLMGGVGIYNQQLTAAQIVSLYNTPTLPPRATDYYAVPLSAGQSASFAVQGNGAPVGQIVVYNNQNELALGRQLGNGVESFISNFVAPASGTYYVQVSGDPGVQYGLVVTRGSDFTLHGNSFNNAQPLDGTSVALGAIVKSGASLFTLDDQEGSFGNPYNPIWPTDPTTGAFIPPSINAPGNPANNPFGLNLAYDGTYLYYNDGAFFGTGTIYKLDPTTGAIIAQTTPPAGFDYGGLAYLNGNLYATNLFTGEIDIFSASTLAFESSISSVGGLSGLTGDPNLGVLFGVAQGFPHGTLYEIDPSTGAVLASAADNNQGAYEQDLAYAHGQLIVSDTYGFGTGNNFLDYYDPSTFAFIQRLPVATVGLVSGLGGDGIVGQGSDWYQFNVNAGDNLVITTTTPGGTSANGLQFQNDLLPTINLYDQNDNLVATATGNAADGRNDVITYAALSTGSYRVQIIGANSDNLGEYTIAIQGATGGLYPFSVSSTNPAAGSDVNYEPSSMTVVFNQSVLLSSITNADLTIDGQTATGFLVVNSNTVSFNLPSISDGVHSVAIAGLVDIHGAALTPDNFTFTTDTVPPFIVSSSITEGEIFSPPPQNVTEVLTFSEPMNESLATFSLTGTVRGISYTGTTSWDSTGTVLTIQYSSLPSDAYQFVVPQTGFEDLAGNFLTSGLTLDFDVVVGTATITGLQPVQPLGSLVYQTTIDNVVVSPSDVDTYNLTIDPHQTLGVLVTPVTTTMTATVTLISPSGNVIGTATSSSAGAAALLPAVQSSKGGTYQIQVSGGPGEYKLTPVLNALIDPSAYGGPPDSSIATAQPIDPYANRFAGHDDRTAVLGQLASAGNNLLWVGPHGQGWNDGSVNVTQINVFQFATQSFNGFNAIYVDADALDSGGLNILQSRAADIASFVNAGGGLITDCGGAFFNPDFSWVPGSAGLSWVPFGDNSIMITPQGATHPIMAGITDAGLSNWFTSQHNYFSATAGLEVLATDNFGDPDVLAGNFGSGRIVYNGIDPSFHQDSNAGQSRQLLLQMVHWAEPPRPVPGDYYSFQLNAGQSATIALQSLNNKKVQFALYDDNGNVVAFGSTGAINYTAGLNNFVAQSDGTYYVEVSGQGSAQFNLVVTRGADFSTQPHSTLATAQDISPTEGSGDPKQGGALGYISNPTAAIVSSTIEGIDFNGNNCGCLPPDTNAAVSPDFVGEAVNTDLRFWDKSGNQVFDESLQQLFAGLGSLGFYSDPYLEYDSSVGRWYLSLLDINNSVTHSDFLFTVSNDSNPLDGFSLQERINIGSSSLVDFDKMGYNADAIVITANDFGNNDLQFVAIDKSQLVLGNFVDYTYTRQPMFFDFFRAFVAAQAPTANPGDPVWFMSTDGYPNSTGNTTIRVTSLTNELSNNPQFTDYTINVNTFGQATGAANQPGAPSSVATNDTTVTQVQYLSGMLVTAFSATDPSDSYATTRAHWYEVDVSTGTPALVQEGVINPGPGVSTFFPTAALDPAGDVGITYMESSSTEFVSSYVAGHIAGTPLGTTTPGVAFAPGAGFMPASFREGDYSSVVYDPSTNLFWAANEYAGPNAGTDLWNTRIASFSLFSGLGTDYYYVNANAGDKLHFATTTPAGGPGEFINNFYPELLLYDNNGNLVAIANGNASDGRNSVIDFTVPDGGAGKWTIEVTPAPPPEGQLASFGEYGLLATGATGGVSPFSVTATTPATGALVQPPTDYIVTFSQSIYAPSLTPGELTINGVPAIAVSLVNANTVDWTIAPGSIPPGERVLNTAILSADSGGQRVQDVSGALLADFTSTFTTDTVPPAVISSSIDGSLISPAPASFSEVVTFSEPMNTSFTTSSSFDLYGNFRNVHYAAASFSWDPSGTTLTINYTNVPDDTYTLTLFAGGFEDLVGLPLSSDYVANFAVALGTAPFALPLSPVKPLGDLIYTGTDDPVLVTPTDVDNLTLPLNAGETLTVVATPTTSTLQLVVSVLDPSSTVIATATASAPGQNTVIETAPASTGGTYTIQISDANGNIGLYSVQAYLNSYVKQGTSNDTIATAQDISSSSFLLGGGVADRLAVVGSLPPNPLLAGDTFVAARYYGFSNPSPTPSDILRVNEQGNVVQVIPVYNDLLDTLSGVELNPVNNMLYAAVTTAFNGSGATGSTDGALLEFDPATGQQVGTITLPPDPADYGTLYPFGFSFAPDGTIWLAQPNGDNIIHVDSSGNLLKSYPLSGFVPLNATLGTNGEVYFGAVVGSNGPGVYQLDPPTGNLTYFAYQQSPALTNVARTGGIWSTDFGFFGSQRFDYSGNLLQQVGGFGSAQAQTDPAGNVWNSNYAFNTLYRFDQFGNQQLSTPVPGAVGLTVWGIDNPNAPVQDTQDFYSFDLSQGQSATIVVESLNGAAAHVTLLDGNGNVLATGVDGSNNVTESIQNFQAQASATYFVEVSGDPGLQYSLTVTRGANFNIEPNSTYNTAQSLTGTSGVLGYLNKPASALFTLDDQEGIFGNPYNPIWPTDLTTGVFIPPSINAPGNPSNNPFGLNLAYDGTYLYYNDGAFFGTGTIYKLDPTTGAIIAQTTPPSGFDYGGLAYLNGNLYATNLFTGAIDVFSTSTLTYETTIQSVGGLSGLTGDPDLGVLFGVAQGFPNGTLYEIDPSTGAVIASAPDNNQGAYEQDLAYANGQLIVSDTYGFGTGNNFLDYYDPSTFAFIQRLPVATLGLVSGLGGGVVTASKVDNDWYTINVQAGQSLFLQSSTPSDQGNQFPNNASLEIELYDTFGNLVAVGTKLPDGRNVSLFYNAPLSGAYHIHVYNDPGSFGEYFLQVDTAQYQSGGISGEVYNDLNGSGAIAPGDPGLDNWEVDLFNSAGVFVASQQSFGGGNYNFQGLDPGTYTVSEVLQDGWTQTQPVNPDTYTLTVTAGSTLTGNNFGNFQNITISGEKFNDLNGNGVQEPGEPGLPGWTIDLVNSAGAIVATTVTDANGNYSFTNVGPGTYTVEEELQPGWVQTDPAPPGTYTVAASSGTDVSGLLFGNFQLVTYSGEVYNDINGNGSLDPGEPGLAGWTINLLSNGSIIATTTSAADGTYNFANLGPGTYTIEEVNQTGWYQTQPAQPFVYTIAATSGGSNNALNFGNFQLVNVAGEVYNDLNDNGMLDPGEPGLMGWTVNLFDAAGNMVATTTSDANGNYQFDSLFPGTFTIEEVLQSGWTQTQPVNPDYYTVTTQSGQNETGLNFGNFLSSVSLSGSVYNDLNGDGTRESGEPALAGWTIDLFTTSGALWDSTTTDSKGNYAFPSEVAQTYIVEEVVMPGWIITQPTNPPGTYTVPPTAGGVTGLDFGDFKTVSVTGNVYNDVNGDGVRQSGEPGLQGWTVDLMQNGSVVQSVTTDANGNYAFTGVAGGSYQVSEVVQSNWVQTQPLYPTSYSFTSKSGHNLSSLNFGDHASPALSPSAVIDNGQPGYSETGSWNTAVGGFNGTNRVAKTEHASGHTATATWDFTGVGSGLWQVWVTFASKSNYSQAAPFTVYDGGTSLGTTDLNQSILVTSTAQPQSQGSYGGVGWLELGTFTISSGELKVLLSNMASGNFVDADGVLIVADPPAPAFAQPGALTSSASLALGVVPAAAAPMSQSQPSATATETAAPTVSLKGVSQPAALRVVYNQGAAPNPGQPSGGLIDAALADVASPTKPLSSDLIASVAKDRSSSKNGQT
jgi:methionine-rich copper-binding protein CopC